MHEIQQGILQKISLSSGARYSELKRKDIDGNLFVYHLNSLKKQGYIVVKDKLYTLTPSGKLLMGRMSFDTFKERIQPTIVTTLIVEKDGKYLLWRRKRSPFLNHVCFPYGKIHLEERLQEAAERELMEKTGISAKLEHRGDVYLTVHNETELVSHLLSHVFYGKSETEEIKHDYPGGECFWGLLEDIPREEILPGAKQMLELVKTHKKTGHFFDELFLNTSEK